LAKQSQWRPRDQRHKDQETHEHAGFGSDEKMKIAPPLKHTLEEALEYIQADEYVEVTPQSIRLRKFISNENERKRNSK
jgi:predicted membrane GTPase involved in stress response